MYEFAVPFFFFDFLLALLPSGVCVLAVSPVAAPDSAFFACGAADRLGQSLGSARGLAC
jgi:hypothetical protein